MNDRKHLTKYVAQFVDELAKSGLENVVISPGSRSTPLAMTVCEHKALKEWIIVDERSAAYFALGMAKQTKKAVALICTSGSAPANYYPAIIEAFYNRVPLIVLTADRPHELRDVGASQAIDQIKMYGDHVKWFQEMPLPEASDEMLSFSRTTANRAVHMAQEGNSGPVQINFPFREPLIPDFSIDQLWEPEGDTPYQTFHAGVKKIPTSEIEKIIQQLKNKSKGMIVCGPQEDPKVAEAIITFSQQWKLPLLADPLSQIRGFSAKKDYLIEHYDAIFRIDPLRRSLQPDFIIRFGDMPISKHYSFYAKEHEKATHFVIEQVEGFRQPTKQATKMIYAHPKVFIEQLLETAPTLLFDEKWLKRWQKMNKKVAKVLQEKSSTQLTEGSAVQYLLQETPEESILYVGNSMPVRDLDSFYEKKSHQLTVLGNRGASGIEGLTSSALGVSATTNKRVTLLLGDLSFYHDLNGLLTAKQYSLDLTIVLINNNGGGIFSFLPQAKERKHFEKLFATPLNVNFKPVVEMYGGAFMTVKTIDELKQSLQKSYHSNGLNVIEVKTDRKENVRWHEKIWTAVERELLDHES